MSRFQAATPIEGWEPRWARFLYGLVAPVYNRIRPLWSSRAADASLDALFAERIGPSTRVLELAPGTGINLKRLFRYSPDFGSYLGLDVSPSMLARARGVSRADPRVTLELGDARNLSPVGRSFDFIVCTWLLSHLEYPERAVRSAMEHLEPGGTAAFLFFTRPEGLLLRALMSLWVRSFRGSFVRLGGVCCLPHCESVRRYGGGYATLAVFRRAI